MHFDVFVYSICVAGVSDILRVLRQKPTETVALRPFVSRLSSLFRRFKLEKKRSVGACLCPLRAACYFPQRCDVWPTPLAGCGGL